MNQLLELNADNPQARLIRMSTEAMKSGAVIAYPTDSAYALGCCMGHKKPLERIRAIRQLSEKHNMTLMCRDLRDISHYALLENPDYRFLKAHTPGPYTFILKATKSVPKLLLHPKRKTIGIRISTSKIVQTLLTELDCPILTCTLILPDEELPLVDPHYIQKRLGSRIDLILASGQISGREPTTVVDLQGNRPEILRKGMGSLEYF